MSTGSNMLSTVLGGAVAIGVLKTVDKMGKKKTDKAKSTKKAKSKKKKDNKPFAGWV